MLREKHHQVYMWTPLILEVFLIKSVERLSSDTCVNWIRLILFLVKLIHVFSFVLFRSICTVHLYMYVWLYIKLLAASVYFFIVLYLFKLKQDSLQ